MFATSLFLLGEGVTLVALDGSLKPDGYYSFTYVSMRETEAGVVTLWGSCLLSPDLRLPRREYYCRAGERCLLYANKES